MSLRHRRPEIARLLAEAGVAFFGDVHGKDFIMLAARNGMNVLIDVAIDNGFDVNRWPTGMNRASPLYEAARAGYVDTVRHLISKGAVLPDKSVNIQNLFRFAAEHPEVLRVLLIVYIHSERNRLTDTQFKSRVRDSKNADSFALFEEFGIRKPTNPLHPVPD